jgi:hypothetical protein
MGLIFAFGRERRNEIFDWPSMIVTASAQVALFAAAVMTTCIVRQAVYSAILSIAAVTVGVFSTHFAWKAGCYLGLATDVGKYPMDQLDPLYVVGLLNSFVVCSLFALLAMRNDWGLKSR